MTMPLRRGSSLQREPRDKHPRQSTRRALLAGAGVLAVAPFAAACGAGGGTGASGTTGEVPPAKLKAGATLTYWNDMGGAYPGLMQQWAETFQQRTGVKVEATGGIGGYGDKLNAAFAGGSPPDVWRYLQENIPIPAAVERNMLLKLDPFIKRDKYDLSDFRKDSIILYQWKGSQYALPRDYGLQLIFYNTDLFAKLGLPPIPTDWNDKTWTFQKFVETCVRLANSGERYALFVPRGARLWASFVYSNGGAIVKKNADGLATEIALAEKPATDALQLMQDLIYKYKVAPQPSEEGSLGNQLDLIQQGRLALQITNPGANSNYKRVTGLPYDVGVFPLGAAARRGVGGGGTGWGIAASTKLPEEAWAFIAYIASREGEMDEVRIGQTTPSRVSVATSQEYLAPPPAHARVFADGQEYVVRDPVHTRWPDVQRDVVDKILSEELWTGKSSAAQVTKLIKEQGDPYFK
jgi:ABC-type glycerol-3-phosphate transport system substrate-binding protein